MCFDEISFSSCRNIVSVPVCPTFILLENFHIMTVMTLVSDCYKITKSVFEISALSDIYFLT